MVLKMVKMGLAISCFILASGCLGVGIKRVLDGKDVGNLLVYLYFAIIATACGLTFLGVF